MAEKLTVLVDDLLTHGCARVRNKRRVNDRAILATVTTTAMSTSTAV